MNDYLLSALTLNLEPNSDVLSLLRTFGVKFFEYELKRDYNFQEYMIHNHL